MRMEAKDLPRSFRASRAFVLTNTGEREGRCGHYGDLDRFGYCLDEDCRHKRLVHALMIGKARKLPNGVLLWDVE